MTTSRTALEIARTRWQTLDDVENLVYEAHRNATSPDAREALRGILVQLQTERDIAAAAVDTIKEKLCTELWAEYAHLARRHR